MHHHIRHLTDIQDLVTHRGEEAYATFLDFEKAYDRVNWTYMFRVLEKMGGGKRFIDWVRLLYNNTKAQLMINGNITPSIKPQRGVKQGDPLSALLFLMTIEPLRNLLRQHEEHGIWINGTTFATGFFYGRFDIAFKYTKWCFDATRTRPSLLRWIGCETQLE